MRSGYVRRSETGRYPPPNVLMPSLPVVNLGNWRIITHANRGSNRGYAAGDRAVTTQASPGTGRLDPTINAQSPAARPR